MKLRTFCLFTLLAAMQTLAAFGLGAQNPAQHYALNVKDFSELCVVDGINVDYVCMPDSAGYAVFDARPEVASQIMFEPSGGKLKVQLASRDVDVDRLPTVRVYSRYLTSVENSGDSLVRVLSLAPGPKFKATLMGNGRLSVRGVDANEASAVLATGNGQLVVTGRCSTAKLRLAGTGSIVADDLEADDVSCTVAGTGTIGCWAKNNLSASGLGSADVIYRGEPNVRKRGIGLRVRRIDQNQ